MNTETLEKKSIKFSARNSEDVKRGNLFKIDPLKIKVDWTSNPRIDYGDDFEEFKQTIKNEGIKQNLELYVDSEGNWHLAHGFRRMKAVLELHEEGHTFESVPFDEVDFNEEQLLVDHFVLNSGKALTDLEMAYALQNLKTLSGEDNMVNLAKRIGLKYIKVTQLLEFAKKSGTQIKNEIAAGHLSFSSGMKIVKAAENITEQNQILSTAKDNAQKAGSNKVRVSHLPIEHPNVTVGDAFEKALTETLEKFETLEGLDKQFFGRVKSLIEMIKTGAPEDEVKLLFIP